jgi:hypothetical protein
MDCLLAQERTIYQMKGFKIGMKLPESPHMPHLNCVVVFLDLSYCIDVNTQIL